MENIVEGISGDVDYTRHGQRGMAICDGGRGQDADVYSAWRGGRAVAGVFFDTIRAFVSPAQSSILESVATCELHEVRVGK